MPFANRYGAQQRLRAFLSWLSGLAGIFGVVEGVAFVVFQDAAFGVASLTSAGCFVAFLIARGMLGRGWVRMPALLVYATILVGGLVSGIAWPTLLPMVVLLPLLALVMALPFIWGRILYGMILAAWFVIMTAAIIAEVENRASAAPQWAISVFRISTLGAAAAFVLVLLVQFSIWLTESLVEAERANTTLLNTQAQLKATLQAREAMAERMARLQAITAAFSEALTPAQVAQVVLDQGIAALDAYAGAVVILHPERDELETIAAADYSAELLEPWRRFSPMAPVPIAQTVRTGEPIWIETSQALEQEFPEVTRSTRRSAAWATLPLTVDGRTIGGLALSFTEERVFNAEDRAFMQALARQCAQALERARLYEAEQRAHQEAQDAVRTRDIFLSIASHELRTPLTSLFGYTNLLLRRAHRGAPFADDDQEILAVIAEQAQRLDQMIEILLDISRLSTGQFQIERQPLNLIGLTERLVDELQPTLSTHKITVEDQGSSLIVAGDELRLRQVLSNLLGNAVKYSPNGGPISVCLEQREVMACVSVTDHGIGIPQAEIPNLFRLFYRAANASAQPIAGIGIGLAVVKEIVTQHGGTVEVASAEGQGSTFTICLPLLDARG